MTLNNNKKTSSLHLLKPLVGATIIALSANTSAFAQGFIEGITPEPNLSMVEWANSERKLSEKSSPEPGQWKTSRTPFLAEIMESLSSTSDVQDVTLMKGTQIGGTEVGNNFVGYVIDHSPGPMMCVQPTLDMAKRYSRQRLNVMIKDMPSLQEKVADIKSKDSSNTTLEKDFIGGYLVITGANSAAGLRSMPVCFLFLDEVDAYPHDVDKEGDPEQLAVKRTQNFTRKKILRVSTPTIDQLSRIQKSFIRGDQRYYHVPCPECGASQKLQWKQLKWNKKLPREQQPSSVFYECEHCHSAIQEHHKTNMLADGIWIPENPAAPKKRRSYHINSLYSPLGWYSWSEAVEDWLNAQGDVELLKTFTNTVLAETWKETVNDVSAKMLQAKAEPYELGKVPKGGLVLYAGVDTQPDRLEAYIYAVGKGEETWLVDYEVFLNDPSIPENHKNSPWTELKDWTLKPRQHECGTWCEVQRTCVDTGGHNTQDVYNFCRNNSHLGFTAIKGASVKNKPIIGRPSKQDINWNGRVIKHGLDLYMVGSDTAKNMIYNRFMREETSGAGCIHYPDALSLEIFEQLTAEKLIRKYHKGFAVYEWIKSSAVRNEALDCTVYAIAGAYKDGIHRWSNARWDKLEAEVQPIMGDLFSQSPPPPKIKPSQIPQNQGLTGAIQKGFGATKSF